MRVNYEDPQNLFVSKVSGLCEDLAKEDVDDMENQTDISCHNTTTRRLN